MENIEIVNNNFISIKNKNLMGFLSNFYYLPIVIRLNISTLFKLVDTLKLKLFFFLLCFKINT